MYSTSPSVERTSTSLPDETNGIGFYVFDDIADPRAFKDVYREQLDAAPWDADEQERVVAGALGSPLNACGHGDSPGARKTC